MSSLQRLATMLRAEGGLIATLVGEGPSPNGGGAQGPAQLAASGPRAERARGEYELLLEAIYEGYLLHYGKGRIVCPPDPDLALLAGDQLYALGLARLVELGDVDAVAELADVITLCALAEGAGEEELAQAVWAAGAVAVGWGTSTRYEQAKDLARAGSPRALGALLEIEARTPTT